MQTTHLNYKNKLINDQGITPLCFKNNFTICYTITSNFKILKYQWLPQVKKGKKEINKYFKGKKEIKYRKLEVSILKMLLEVVSQNATNY